MKPEFTGKVALVTGGAMGIGEAVAVLLAERGAQRRDPRPRRVTRPGRSRRR